VDEPHGSLDRVVADEHNIVNYTRKVRQRLDLHRSADRSNSFELRLTRSRRSVHRNPDSTLISGMNQSQSEIARRGGDERPDIRGQSVDKKVGATAFERADGIPGFDLANKRSPDRS